MYPEAEKSLKQAKMALISRDKTVFYTTILFSLKQLFTEEIPTASVDGEYLRINPIFWCSLGPAEQIGLLVHECLHIGLMHLIRLEGRDPKKFNIAADHVINISLADNGYILPAGGLCDYRYRDMSTEQVYNALPPDPDGGKGMGSQDIVYADPKDKKKTADIKEKVAEIVLRASTQAKMANTDPGTLPEEIDIALEKQLNPKLPWDIILQNYMNNFAKEDYSFQRPNKRFFPEFYLPTAHSEAICNIVAAFDVSGSTTDKMVSSYAHNLIKIQQDLKPEIMTVLGFDTRIVSEQEMTPQSDILKELKFKGRGGTNISPVLKWAEKEKPTVMLIFSDGEFRIPPKPKGPTAIIFIINDDPNWSSPYGKVIHYNSET